MKPKVKLVFAAERTSSAAVPVGLDIKSSNKYLFQNHFMMRIGVSPSMFSLDQRHVLQWRNPGEP
jgi:hypothetical protein